MVKSENPITDRKNSTSRESSTPFWKPSKWVMTLNDVTRSTSHGLRQLFQQVDHRREAGQDQEQADHHAR